MPASPRWSRPPASALELPQALSFTRAYVSDPRTRKRWRLASQWLSGDGIEIGALYRPLHVPPDVRVSYVDRLDEAGLREHYPELAEEAFVPVDILGSAEDLSALPPASVDFVVANHLIEHLEYPIRGLREFERVLRPDGVVYMAIPDGRVGIDHDRPPTPLEHFITEEREGAESNRPAHYLDWVVNCEKLPDDAENRAKMLQDMNYSIHFHVWWPETFLDFWSNAAREAGLDLHLITMAPPEYPGDDEFIVILGKGSQASPRLPLRYRSSLRARLKKSPAGPLLAGSKRWLRTLGKPAAH